MHQENFIPFVSSRSENNEDIKIRDSQNQIEFVTHSRKSVFLKVKR